MPPSRPTQNPNLVFNNPWGNYSYEEKTPLRLNLKKFDGKNVGDEFMIFMEQFMALCGEKNIRPKKKLCYLMAFLEGPALQTVKQAIGRSLWDDSYQKALKALQDRFGGEERMKRNYLNDLRSFAPMTKFTADGLWKLHYLISDIREWMIDENPTQIHDQGSFVVQNIKEILPEKELGFYLDEIEHYGQQDCLDTLHVYIHRKAKAAQNTEESRRKSGLQQRSFISENKEHDSEPESAWSGDEIGSALRNADKAFATEQKSSSYRPKTFQTIKESLGNKIPTSSEDSTKKLTCPHCNEPHVLWKCDSFRILDIQSRYNIVRNKRLCYHCLSAGHGAKKCTFNKDRKCGIQGCDRYHNRLLHKPKEVSFVSIEEFVEEMDYGWEESEPTEPQQGVACNTTENELLRIRCLNYLRRVSCFFCFF